MNAVLVYDGISLVVLLNRFLFCNVILQVNEEVQFSAT